MGRKRHTPEQIISAAKRGTMAERIMDHTGHKSGGMVRVYTRRADAFQD